MAHSRSARKRIRQNLRHNARNKHWKSTLRSQLKKTLQVIQAGKPDIFRAELKKAYSLLDKAAVRDIIHHNRARRIKSRLTLKAASIIEK